MFFESTTYDVAAATLGTSFKNPPRNRDSSVDRTPLSRMRGPCDVTNGLADSMTGAPAGPRSTSESSMRWLRSAFAAYGALAKDRRGAPGVAASTRPALPRISAYGDCDCRATLTRVAGGVVGPPHPTAVLVLGCGAPGVKMGSGSAPGASARTLQ